MKKTKMFALISIAILASSVLLVGFTSWYGENSNVLSLTQVEDLNKIPTGVEVYANQINVTSSTTIPIDMGPMQSNVSMYSFSIFGLINPTISIKEGATVKLIEINIDDDSSHNFAITTVSPPYYYMGAGMMGQNSWMGNGKMLVQGPIIQPHNGNNYFYHQMQFDASQNGTFWYLCQVPGHAANGMYGKIVVL